MSGFRLVEDALGPDALERPSREAVAALWAKARLQPIPDYPAMALRRFRFPLAGRPK